jgi:guanosine-3',5'-bis(diphosphate) 3'-pyrophosphohydrolase
MVDIKEIVGLMRNPTKKDTELIRTAAEFAWDAHKDHKRDSGEPHYVHLYATARNLAEIGMGATTISAGFLHDVIEDTGVTAEDVEKTFGSEIRFLVEGVTKLKKLKYHGRERIIGSMRKLFVAMAKDIRVLIIKLNDRLHNMQTLEHVSKERAYRTALESLEIFAPLAYRLGMRKLNRQLEDLAFPYVFPEEYKEIKSLLNQRYKKNLEYVEKFHKSIKKALAKEGITEVETEIRIKSFYSLYKKYIKKEKDIEKIYDICAVRVIVPSISDCYRTLGILHAHWTPLPGRIKDYIALPKLNGYRSIHTTLFTGDGGILEVQIRTQEMHREAEFGIASHISYKEGKKKDNANLVWIKYLLPKNEIKDFEHGSHSRDIPYWVKHLAEIQETIADGDEFMDNLKKDFFEHRIFVFNTKGEVVDLPIGATPIDFAYALDPEIGNHICSVKLNGKMTSIDRKLDNGDIIELETKKTCTPTEKWLQIVKTGFAKREIRLFLEKK